MPDPNKPDDAPTPPFMKRLVDEPDKQPKKCWQQRDPNTLYVGREGFCDCWKGGMWNLCRYIT